MRLKFMAEQEPQKMPSPEHPDHEVAPSKTNPEVYPAHSPNVEPRRESPEIQPSRDPEIGPVPSPGIPMPGGPEIAPYS